MGHTHDVIQNLAVDFATDAWSLLSRTDPGVSGILAMSHKEYFRFCRAFYRTELFFNLYRDGEGGLFNNVSDNEYQRFVLKHSPWEN
jgi:hypothetical protein